VKAAWRGTFDRWTPQSMYSRVTVCRSKPMIPGVMLMPHKLPPHVERKHVKGKTYVSFRIGQGAAPDLRRALAEL
jgi:hypothetical protein